MNRRSFLKLALAPAAALLGVAVGRERRLFDEEGRYTQQAEAMSALKLVRPGRVPTPAEERHLLELLAKAEHDPCAWLVAHYEAEFFEFGPDGRARLADGSWCRG